jgi:SAM-dependent methyltransferase
MPALNSDLYDYPALYDALLPVRAHLPYYAELARQASGDILELACGTGQLTVPLAGAGLHIAGLDLSAPMLSTARKRAATANVSVEYVLGDMRTFSLGRRFALIFIARNSLLHLHSTEDILAAFSDGQTALDAWRDLRVRHIQSGYSLTREAFRPALSRFSSRN